MWEVKTPATSANLGSGFDTLGIALSLYNVYRAEIIHQNRDLVVEIIGEGVLELPRDSSNAVVKAMKSVYSLVGAAMPGVKVTCLNAIPLKRGLGSSSSAAVGGVLLGNAMLGYPLNQQDILRLVVEMEGHPDNAVPCLVGGLVVSCVTEGTIRHVNVPFPKELYMVVAVPEVHVSTHEARMALPEMVPLEDAVFNLSRLSLLIASFASGRLEHIPWTLDDRLHQQFRAKLFPGGEEILEGVRHIEGCLGVVISGSGPSMLALVSGNPQKVAGHMCGIFSLNGVRSRFFVLDVDEQGSVVTERR